MKKLIYLIDSKINLITILFLFWALFWGLNGFDKFFNGTSQVIYERWASQGYLVEKGTENIVYSIQPSEKVGWYGVSRDAKFANYFRTLNLPPIIATITLYFFAVLEIILAFLFFWLFLKQFSRDKDFDVGKPNLFTDRTVHRLIFKLSIWIFIAFLAGDILFGDRTEVWEHGSYLLMTIVTYDLWYRTDQFFIEMKKKNMTAEEQEALNLQASSYNWDLKKEEGI